MSGAFAAVHPLAADRRPTDSAHSCWTAKFPAASLPTGAWDLSAPNLHDRRTAGMSCVVRSAVHDRLAPGTGRIRGG